MVALDDLRKKFLFAHKAIAKKKKNVCETRIKVCTILQVSPITASEPFNAFLKKLSFAKSNASADNVNKRLSLVNFLNFRNVESQKSELLSRSNCLGKPECAIAKAHKALKALKARKVPKVPKACEAIILYVNKDRTKNKGEEAKAEVKVLIALKARKVHKATKACEAVTPESRKCYKAATSAKITKAQKKERKVKAVITAFINETLTLRHQISVIQHRIATAGDVHPNPGPPTPGRPPAQGGPPPPSSQSHSSRKKEAALSVTTYNVRGLNDGRKMRHLTNYVNKLFSKNKDVIAGFQETYVEKAGRLPFMLRGNFVQTAGNGNSLGVITMLSHHLNVVGSKHIGSRAHVLACQRASENSTAYIIANVYAPNQNNEEKIKFFEELADLILEFEEVYDCKNTIVLGDLNVVLDSKWVKNRQYNAPEKKIAKAVNELMLDLNLTNACNEVSNFTWRRPNTDVFSTIDYVFHNTGELTLVGNSSDWSLSMSDHAAVKCDFAFTGKEVGKRSKVTRLDPSLIKDRERMLRIKEVINALMAMIPADWNPHIRLDYLKMCTRTVWEKHQAERKRIESDEEAQINEELNKAISKLETSDLSEREKADLIEYIEELRIDKASEIEKKGERLAEKLGTKWYNEGEKSTRYFMRLLNRPMPDKFKELENANGELIKGETEIEAEIVSFYKNLYESYDKSKINVTEDQSFLNEINPITGDREDQIVKPIDIDELGRTLKTCRDSAPGPDGICYSIISALWNHYGPTIVEAWNHSLRTGKLTPSHKVSFLKLIPKAGKDPKKLTNWRPITLSNCDHKIITKTYSNRICKEVTNVIGARQTAYLKGRLINDNVRGLIASINVANTEENIDGLIVSLDAKKAFDSVEHGYIERCLISFGLGKFVPIFKTLYSELSSDILINGKIVKGFQIKRSVKQGDALSCVLFIMCMEPLLRNIEVNNDIGNVRSGSLEKDLPKVYAYADDVNAVIKNNQASIQALFQEYGRLTNASGLELNADKTEILKIKTNNAGIQESFNVNYLDREYNLTTCQETKINGILLQQDPTAMQENNVRNAIGKMKAAFAGWSRRGLSTLGKILIAKTYGISQIIFLMQSLMLNVKMYKEINAMLYKFIWNRHFNAAKAPERIKREIVNKPINLGGLGMLDVCELDEGLKLRALGRLLNTEHPMLRLIRDKLDNTEYFYPSSQSKLDPVTVEGIKLLGIDRRKLLFNSKLKSDRITVGKVREMKLHRIIKPGKRPSILFFNAWISGIRKVGDLSTAALEKLRPIIITDLMPTLENAVRLNLPESNARGALEEETFYDGKSYRKLSSLTSKEIRISRCNNMPICDFKIGLVLTQCESLSYFSKIRKLSSTKHKDTILRILHKEVYTKSKLHRYGLADSPKCPRCDEIEDLTHKVVLCAYAERIWKQVISITNPLRTTPATTNIGTVVGADIGSNLVTLTINAEVCQRILYLKDSNEYLIHPRKFVELAIKAVERKEKDPELKRALGTLLAD